MVEVQEQEVETMWRQASAEKPAENSMMVASTEVPFASRPVGIIGGDDALGVRGAVDSTAVVALSEALTTLRTSHGMGAVSASRMINPLIDLWDLASTVDPSVA